MKLAFIFDTRFIKYKNHYYSINLTSDIWKQRYLKVFESIVVVGRYIEVKNNPIGRYVRSDIENVEFRCIKDQSKLKRIMNLREEKEFIAKEIADCDAAICRTWWGVSECVSQKKPYLMEVINCIWDSYWNHGIIGKIVAFPNYVLQRQAIKKAPYSLYVTEKFLQNRYPSNGKSEGVSDVFLSNDISDEILLQRQERIENLKKKIVLGTAAAINVPYKGQRFVIRAIANLCDHNDFRFEYKLAGSGDPKALKRYAKQLKVDDRIDFCGPIPHEKMGEWRNSIDIYIQPSLQEGLPRAVVEAMSVGIPCIGSDCGGIPELIEPQFICKRKAHLSSQIFKQLQSLTKNDLLHMSKYNFNFAKKFNSDLLNKRRIEFMKDFRKYCEER